MQHAASQNSPLPAQVFVPCALGLEYLLVDELLALGAPHATAARAGVNLHLPAQAPAAFLYRVLMWSRLASRVLWPLADGRCTDTQRLYALVQTLDWQAQLAPGQRLAVAAHVSGTYFRHSRYAAQLVKDAIVDQLRARTGTRPAVDLVDPDLRLQLVIQQDQVQLAVDLGNGPLHRRGWRQTQGAAPLKENLAAAMLLRGGWPNVYAAGGSLLDPMCGSGTLLIEGALMAAGQAPGLQRQAPTRWLGFDQQLWQQLYEEASAQAVSGMAALRSCFLGMDQDAAALAAARDNAVRAGVAEFIEWRQQSLPALQQVSGTGLVACNAPYNERLATDLDTYAALGQALQQAVPDWRAVLLCGNDELARATGLRARKSYQFFNGPIACALLLVDRIGQPARQAQPVLSAGAQMLSNRLQKNLARLKGWRKGTGVTCYRCYDTDLPEYAAAVDIYEDVQQLLYAHVQEYQAPANIDPQQAALRLNELVQVVAQVLALPATRIAVKQRRRGKGGSKYGRQAQRGEFIAVQEGAAKLWVNLFDYLDTGLFLDHRPLRRQLAAQAAGKRVLNLFCYTGVVSIQAALAGAAQTLSVDLSATYLDWAQRNFKLNALPCILRAGENASRLQPGANAPHQLQRADVMQFLAQDRGQYDLIFCDPPTFSNSKRAADFDVQRDHISLLQLALPRLAMDGVLYFSNNYRRFRLDETALSSFCDWTEISAATFDPDFVRRPNMHRVWRIRRRTV